MEKILAVYDTDAIYATRFLEFFRKRKDIEFEIIVFTNQESLKEYASRHKIEILLFDGSFSPENELKENIRYIYELSEHQSRDQDTGYPRIFKYQEARQVMAEISAIYNGSEINEQGSYSPEGFEIVTIFSPIPDANKLIFAWSLSILLSEKKKILFIPLDGLPVSVLSQEEDLSQSLSEFIYYLKENNPNITAKMKSLLHYIGNLAYLSGLTHGLDLFSLTKEEVSNWTEDLKNHTDYDAVVFYISYYCEAVVEILDKSTCIFTVLRDDPYEKAVIREWERQMEFIGMKEKLAVAHRQFLPNVEWTDEKCPSLQVLKGSPIWNHAMQIAEEM